MPEQPTQFVELVGGSAITEYALHLIADHDGVYDPMGSAVLIAPNLALTAKHVVEDYLARLQRGPSEYAEFRCRAIEQHRDGTTGRSTRVLKYTLAGATDLALLLLTGEVSSDWRPPVLDMLPPEVGTGVAAFGYHSCVAEVEEDQVTISRRMSTTVGVVQEVHHERRDDFNLTWPCFRVNARFDGGMSGGPVFDQTTGRICGIISTNMPPSGPGEEHVSYVTTLWPLLGVPLDYDWPGKTMPVYPLMDLVDAGGIHVANHRGICVERAPDGKPLATSMAFPYVRESAPTKG